jgi:hypothetical protein
VKDHPSYDKNEKLKNSALTRFKAGIFLVDDIKTPATTHDTAVSFAALNGLKGTYNFHFQISKTV